MFSSQHIARKKKCLWKRQNRSKVQSRRQILQLYNRNWPWTNNIFTHIILRGWLLWGVWGTYILQATFNSPLTQLIFIVLSRASQVTIRAEKRHQHAAMSAKGALFLEVFQYCTTPVSLLPLHSGALKGQKSENSPLANLWLRWCYTSFAVADQNFYRWVGCICL